MDWANTNGRMVVYTLENLKRDRNTVKESGKSSIMLRIVTVMMENTYRIKRTDSAYFNGKVGMSTKVCIRMMKEMDMVRCTG